MNPALLSRFDLIFILLDKPDEERDQILSEHVMAVRNLFSSLNYQIHGGKDVSFFPTQGYSLSFFPHFRLDASGFSSVVSSEGASLLQKLKLPPHKATKFDPIHPVLLRKYIAYARKFAMPK